MIIDTTQTNWGIAREAKISFISAKFFDSLARIDMLKKAFQCIIDTHFTLFKTSDENINQSYKFLKTSTEEQIDQNTRDNLSYWNLNE